MNIILASSSPRRQQLLSSLGVEFKIAIPDVDENVVLPPKELVCELSRRKAKNIGETELFHDDIIIAADTVVAVNNIVLNKPADEKKAFEMLKILSGNIHYVYTGLSIFKNGRINTEYCVTDVYFNNLNDKQISDYINCGESLDKAGGYGIQSKGACLVKKIDGDYFNVVGLPLNLLYNMLMKYDIDILNLRGI